MKVYFVKCESLKGFVELELGSVWKIIFKWKKILKEKKYRFGIVKNISRCL